MGSKRLTAWVAVAVVVTALQTACGGPDVDVFGVGELGEVRGVSDGDTL